MTQSDEAKAVITRLGGPVAVARLCRIRSQAVSQWKRFGIPAARRDYLQLLHPEAFGEAAADVQSAPDGRRAA